MKKEHENQLVRTTKSIIVNPEQSDYIDEHTVRRQFYNAFHSPMLKKGTEPVNLTIGVTSASKGEGKTLTASNLAVSFALAYNRKTVLVDLNLHNPGLHKIFGTSLKPGLAESFHNGSIFLSRTRLDKLYLLPAGKHVHPSLGLSDIAAVRDILVSLRREFDIIVLDMNSIFPIEEFPAAFANQVDGLLVVVDTTKTKYQNIERIFRHINKKQAMGFVFNRVEEAENF